MKWGLKGKISIYADSGPLRYVLWCFGSISHQLFTFIHIYSGHTVSARLLHVNARVRELPKPGKRRSFPKICLFCRVDLLQQTNSSWYCRQMGRSGCSIFTITHPWDNLVDFSNINEMCSKQFCSGNSFAIYLFERTKFWHIVIRNERKKCLLLHTLLF